MQINISNLISFVPDQPHSRKDNRFHLPHRFNVGNCNETIYSSERGQVLALTERLQGLSVVQHNFFMFDTIPFAPAHPWLEKEPLFRGPCIKATHELREKKMSPFCCVHHGGVERRQEEWEIWDKAKQRATPSYRKLYRMLKSHILGKSC